MLQISIIWIHHPVSQTPLLSHDKTSNDLREREGRLGNQLSRKLLFIMPIRILFLYHLNCKSAINLYIPL